MELTAGVSIGPYQLVEPAGAGGMAEVWRAFHPRLQRFVAIKFLSPRFATDPSYLERFLREARAISRLDHPNILTVLDFGEQGGWTYMVSPFIGGGTLADRLNRGPWTVAESVAVLEPLAAALDHAHAVGLVHRDVKPSNVLFTEHGRLVLSDFGVARMVEGTSLVSQAGLVIGTPMYMSPEQANADLVTGASDLYSLGVVAYQMLTGRPPFMAETPLALLRAHIDKPLPPPRTLNPALPVAVEGALLAVLSKAPADRFASGAAFVAALRSVATATAAVPPARVGTTVVTVGARTLPPSQPIRVPQPPSHVGMAARPGVSRRRALLGIGAVVVSAGVGTLAWKLGGREALPTLVSAVPGVTPTSAVVATPAATAVAVATAPATLPPLPATAALVPTITPVPALAAAPVVASPAPTLEAAPAVSSATAVAVATTPPESPPTVQAPAAPRGPRTVRVVEGHTGAVNSVTFSRSAELLATGSRDRTARVWRVADGSLVAAFGDHTDDVNDVAISPFIESLATASDDKTVRLSYLDGRPGRVFSGHTEQVASVTFSPDGQTLASASFDGTIRLWRVDGGSQVRAITGHTGPVISVAFSPDGATIASGAGDWTIRLWRAEDGGRLRYLLGHGGLVSSVAFSPDGQFLASSSADGTVRLWRASDGVLLHRMMGHADVVTHVAYSPDGQVLASGSLDETVRVWSVSDGSPLATLTGHTGAVNTVAFSPNGILLASGSEDNTVRIWQAS